MWAAVNIPMNLISSNDTIDQKYKMPEGSEREAIITPRLFTHLSVQSNKRK